jgi:CDGSH-type Zn-finger protein
VALREIKRTNMAKKTEIHLIKNGPALVTGDFAFIDSTGNKRTLGNKLYFCRCGKSLNKPFCDGTHKKA